MSYEHNNQVFLIFKTCSLPWCSATNTASMKLRSQISNVLYGFMLMISKSTDPILRIYATHQKWDWKGEPASTTNNSIGGKGNLEGWCENVWLHRWPRQGFCNFYIDRLIERISYLKWFFFKTLYYERPSPRIISWWWNDKMYSINVCMTMTGNKGLSGKGAIE